MNSTKIEEKLRQAKLYRGRPYLDDYEKGIYDEKIDLLETLLAEDEGEVKVFVPAKDPTRDEYGVSRDPFGVPYPDQSPYTEPLSVENLQLRIADWQDVTFPNSTASSKLSHLAKEIIELSDAIKEDDLNKVKEETADCFHLLFGIASKYGFNALSATEDKFAINQKRQWGKPDENGVVEHIKEASQPQKGEGV